MQGHNAPATTTMNKYRVYGNTTVTIAIEVWANNETQAYEKATNKLDSLTAYCGNGGYDKLVGVDIEEASVSADSDIEYDDIEKIEEDTDYMECPECGEQLNVYITENSKKYWYCEDCEQAYNKDGNEIWIDEEDEEEDEE